MIEIFHATRDLGKVVREGLKAPYQLGLEGKGDNYLFPEEVDKPTTPKMTKFLYKALFFFDESPAGDEWVSISVDENDASIKVGNISLVQQPYMPGKLYEKSVMSLPTYLKRRNQPIKSGKDFENPFTAKMMDWEQMERFENRWGKELEAVIGEHSMFEYQAEILVPRLVVEPSEFHRTSINY